MLHFCFVFIFCPSPPKSCTQTVCSHFLLSLFTGVVLRHSPSPAHDGLGKKCHKTSNLEVIVRMIATMFGRRGRVRVCAVAGKTLDRRFEEYRCMLKLPFGAVCLKCTCASVEGEGKRCKRTRDLESAADGMVIQVSK